MPIRVCITNSNIIALTIQDSINQCHSFDQHFLLCLPLFIRISQPNSNSHQLSICHLFSLSLSNFISITNQLSLSFSLSILISFLHFNCLLNSFSNSILHCLSILVGFFIHHSHSNSILHSILFPNCQCQSKCINDSISIIVSHSNLQPIDGSVSVAIGLLINHSNFDSFTHFDSILLVKWIIICNSQLDQLSISIIDSICICFIISFADSIIEWQQFAHFDFFIDGFTNGQPECEWIGFEFIEQFAFIDSIGVLVQLSIDHFFVDSFIDSDFIVESKSIVIGQQECEWIGIAQQQRIGLAS